MACDPTYFYMVCDPSYLYMACDPTYFYMVCDPTYFYMACDPTYFYMACDPTYFYMVCDPTFHLVSKAHGLEGFHGTSLNRHDFRWNIYLKIIKAFEVKQDVGHFLLWWGKTFQHPLNIYC